MNDLTLYYSLRSYTIPLAFKVKETITLNQIKLMTNISHNSFIQSIETSLYSSFSVVVFLASFSVQRSYFQRHRRRKKHEYTCKSWGINQNQEQLAKVISVSLQLRNETQISLNYIHMNNFEKRDFLFKSIQTYNLKPYMKVTNKWTLKNIRYNKECVI